MNLTPLTKPTLAYAGGPRHDAPETSQARRTDTRSALPRYANAATASSAADAADQFVGAALVAPLLELAADDPLKSDLFGGGFAQDAFKQQLRQAYTDTLASRLELHRHLRLNAKA